MDEPSLRLYSEFEKILTNYEISKQGKGALQNLRLVLLMAATSTGRSVVSRKLIETYNYYYIVSDTTRQPQIRDGKLEQNGVQYFFRTEEEMLSDLKAGNFLEAEIIHEQQVSGISIRELKKAKQSNKTAFTETDIAGVINIKKVKADANVIFLLPPSFKEWQRRMAGRGGLAPQETKRRLTTALRFLKTAPKYDFFEYVIAGDDPKKTAQTIDDIAHGIPNPQQKEGVILAKELLEQLQKVMHL